MSLKGEPFSVKDYFNRLDVIPFPYPQGLQFDLLMAATVRPSSGGEAAIKPMYAGFTSNFFKSLGPPGDDDGGSTDLSKLLEGKEVYEQPNVSGVSDSLEATSGLVWVTLAQLCGVKAAAGTAAAESTCYSLNNMKVHSLSGSPLLVPFLRKHLPIFATNIPKISTTFLKEPTRLSGSVDMVVAIVTANVTGRVEICSEKTQTTSAEVEVPVDPTGSSSVAASASANQSSAQRGRQDPTSGILGASYILLHLHKSVSTGGKVEALNPTLVQSAKDPELTAFCRRVKLKEFRKLVTGRNQASLGFLTEKESHMDSHDDLQSHFQAVQETEAFKQTVTSGSLAAGGWDDDNGIVNLQMGTAVALHDSARLEEAQLLKDYPGSRNFIFSSSQDHLSRMYQNLKDGLRVEVAGMNVKTMSPAFQVDTSGYLPICVLEKDKEEEEDEDDIPGSVVRDFMQDFVFIFPVEGHETKRGCATVYSDWEVRESIVSVGAADQRMISELKGVGFHEIVYEQGGDTHDGNIFMARHQLAREGDPFDGEASGEHRDRDDGEASGDHSDRDADIFRARALNDSSAAVAAASSVPTLLTSTAGTTEESPKRKKTKL